ncbi:MAG: DNA/RNA non-specific endonuclease [Oleiphilus sp.]|nr:MAG: DNA/RNA non-specific endonuclease [Oleiphilus sp.]
MSALPYFLLTLCLLVSSVSSAGVSSVGDTILRLDYEGFTVWLDCERRGAVMFRYNAQRDTGNHKRKSQFYLDPDVPSECQQKATHAYRTEAGRFDRGHLVPANHMDFSENAIRQSNYVTNMLPMRANLNRGAYLRTEEIIECLRDIDELLVIGGTLWGNDSSDDYFLESHGVATPDAFWKVIIRDERVIAWIMPNDEAAKADQLDAYLVTVKDLEKKTGITLPVADYLKDEKPATSWLVPKGCNRG